MKKIMSQCTGMALAFSAIAISLVSSVYAMPALDRVQHQTDADGNKLDIRLKGDESYNWIEDPDGYLIEKNTDERWYYVRDLSGHKKTLSGTQYKNSDSATKPFVKRKDVIEHVKKLRDNGALSTGALSSLNTTSSVQSLAIQTINAVGNSASVIFILVKFNDQPSTYPASDFAATLKKVQSYYKTVSYGIANLGIAAETSGTANDGVIGWLALNRNHPNTGGAITIDNEEVSRAAIVAANPHINYAAYDRNRDGYVDSHELAVVVIVAGQEASISGGQKSVWGHYSAITNGPNVDGVIVGEYHNDGGGYAQFGEVQTDHAATLGVMVHELGHLIFRLPDLYDISHQTAGIGPYGLMSVGSWGRSSSDIYDGQTPVMPEAWTRYRLGWTQAPIGQGTPTVAVAAGASSLNTVFRSATVDSLQYFLIENRQPLGYDRGLESWLGANFTGGILVWHANDNYNMNHSSFPPAVLDLEEADGSNMAGSGNGVFWKNTNAQYFNDETLPRSRMENNARTGIAIAVESASSNAMLVAYGKRPSIPYSYKRDIVWRNRSNAQNSYYGMYSSRIDKQTSFLTNSTSTIKWTANRGDFNGDGFGDLLWRNSDDGKLRLTIMNKEVVVSALALDTTALPLRVLGVGDFNGDKTDDIVLQNNSTGQVWIYLIKNSVVTTRLSVATVSDLNWKVKAIGDFNADGKQDLIWQHSVNGSLWIYLLNGAAILSQNALTNYASGSVIGAGRVLSNGGIGFVTWDSTTGGIYAHTMTNGAVTGFNLVHTGNDPNWKTVQIADFNGDGTDDLLWRNKVTGANKISFLKHVSGVEDSVNTVADLNWEVIP